MLVGNTMEERMAVPPPREPYPSRDVPARAWYGRYWGYYNRPRTGCGCLYTLLLYWLLSLLFTPLAFWY